MIVLLDLGNTRLKWAFARADGALADVGAAAWREQVGATLRAALTSPSPPSRVLAASVADVAREQAIGAVVMQATGMPVEWLRTPAAACGVRNGYATPAQLGIDRFLGLVAARADGRAPCVRASVGTALTLDALDATGRHFPGWIAPGPALMGEALGGATARLKNELAGGAVGDVVERTADAIRSGSLHATAALIDRYVARIAPRLGGDAALLLDGGDAELLAPLLDHACRIERDGVLRGLAHWAGRFPVMPAG